MENRKPARSKRNRLAQLFRHAWNLLLTRPRIIHWIHRDCRTISKLHVVGTTVTSFSRSVGAVSLSEEFTSRGKARESWKGTWWLVTSTRDATSHSHFMPVATRTHFIRFNENRVAISFANFSSSFIIPLVGNSIKLVEPDPTFLRFRRHARTQRNASHHATSGNQTTTNRQPKDEHAKEDLSAAVRYTTNIERIDQTQRKIRKRNERTCENGGRTEKSVDEGERGRFFFFFLFVQLSFCFAKARKWKRTEINGGYV